MRCAPGRNLFGPLLKTLVVENEEPAEALGGREALISAIDRRLRFLAADSRATLRGRWPAYREVRWYLYCGVCSSALLSLSWCNATVPPPDANVHLPLLAPAFACSAPQVALP